MTTATDMLNRELLTMAAAGDRPRCSDSLQHALGLPPASDMPGELTLPGRSRQASGRPR